MGNNKEESARREGMAYALRIAKEKGIEALEKELEFRNITNIPIKISKGQVEAFVEETKQTMFDTILLMSCYSLRDAFGFGNKRLMDFKNKFSEYTESLSGGYMQWQEIAEQMNISVKAVEGHISRALKQIRAYLGDAYHYLW